MQQVSLIGVSTAQVGTLSVQGQILSSTKAHSRHPLPCVLKSSELRNRSISPQTQFLVFRKNMYSVHVQMTRVSFRLEPRATFCHVHCFTCKYYRQTHVELFFFKADDHPAWGPCKDHKAGSEKGLILHGGCNSVKTRVTTLSRPNRVGSAHAHVLHALTSTYTLLHDPLYGSCVFILLQMY